MGQADEQTEPSLFVRQMGTSGPALVLLHGLGASGRSWRLVAGQLRGEARLFCPDLLGFGRSPWPDAAYTVADHVTALDQMLTRLRLGDEPVVLAGHSTGAMLALAWAAARPERFRQVVLLSLPAYRTAEEARRCIRALSPLAWATVEKPWLGERICGVMCAWRPFWRRVVPLLTPGVPADIARDYVMHDWTSYSGTLQHVLIEHPAGPAAARLAMSGNRVELLHGERDTVAPLDAARDLADRHGWPLTVLPGRGHGLLVDAPRACARLLASLLPHPAHQRRTSARSGTKVDEGER
jgi:pimeloyl-ACP methyl ester carboxylesterase